MRVTLRSGKYHEDVGCGSAEHEVFFVAKSNAQKGACTDALKRYVSLTLLSPAQREKRHTHPFILLSLDSATAEYSLDSVEDSETASRTRTTQNRLCNGSLKGAGRPPWAELKKKPSPGPFYPSDALPPIVSTPIIVIVSCFIS